MDRSSDPLVGKTISKYTITSVLGGGGMGTVYRARQAPMNREVAVKVINMDLKSSEQFIRRFEREAKSLGALEHPHIIPVIDFGQEGDLTYLVMSLKNGGNLGDLIKKERLPLPEVYRYVSQIAHALDYAHQRGIIHRDLKPANVLLDEERNAFLTDFGIAKKLGETKLTAQGMVVGSPIYMAPEAWRGEDAGPETDVYSLGIILFEILTGQPPYIDKVPARLMLKHIGDPVPSVISFRPDLSMYIDNVVQRALAKDRNSRYTSATAMAADLKAAIVRTMQEAGAGASAQKSMDEDTVFLATPGKSRSSTPQPGPVPSSTPPYVPPQQPAAPAQRPATPHYTPAAQPSQPARNQPPQGGWPTNPNPLPPQQQSPASSSPYGRPGISGPLPQQPTQQTEQPAARGGLPTRAMLFAMISVIVLLVVVIVLLLGARG